MTQPERDVVGFLVGMALAPVLLSIPHLYRRWRTCRYRRKLRRQMRDRDEAARAGIPVVFCRWCAGRMPPHGLVGIDRCWCGTPEQAASMARR